MSDVFDGAYAGCYDLLYRDKDYAAEAAYVANCLKHQGVEAGAILDLGSGTGKHAFELVRLGYDVHGVDRSAAMVRIANQGSPHKSVGQSQFEIGDVRTYRSGRVFDAIVSLFHVVSYQTSNEDLLATFETAAYHLRHGGLFLFDCWYGPAVLTERPSARLKRVDTEVVTVTRIAEPTLDVRNSVVTIDYTVLVQSMGRELQDRRETHRLRYLFEPEVSDLLKRTGFEVCDAHEWLSHKPLASDTWSATFVARRL